MRGLRVNPQVSSSDYLLADPARPFSRLGEWDPEKIEKVIEQISGFMFHNNCENGDFGLFDKMLSHIEERFGHLLHKVQWVSLGGGIHFTGEDYALDAFCARLKAFSEKYGVQVYPSPAKQPSPRAPRWKSPFSTPCTTASTWPWSTAPSKRTCSTC